MVRVAFSVFFFGLLTQAAIAQIVTVDVTIEEVKPEAHGITVSYSVGDEKKTTTLDVSRKAAITIKGIEATLEGITPGDTAKIEFHKDLAIVTKIEAAGDLLDGWTLVALHPTPVLTPDDVLTVSRDGTLVCTPKMGWLLVSNRTFSEMVFAIEFQPPANEKADLGVIMVGTTHLANMNKDRQQRSPIDSIEIKVSPEKCGEILLPRLDFDAELPLGQIRDGRLVTRVRTKQVTSGQWHKMEVECNSHGNVVVKLDGELVNAIAKAESISGKIGIWPTKYSFKFRNPTVTINGVEEKLDFNVTGVICPK